MISIRLPWPPSVNNLYATVHGRRILSSRGRDFHQRVAVMCRVKLGPPNPLRGRIKLYVVAYPPDDRVRDLSNHIKVIEDALTGARIWIDDSQIDQVNMSRGCVKKPGYVDVEIMEIAAEVKA